MRLAGCLLLVASVLPLAGSDTLRRELAELVAALPALPLPFASDGAPPFVPAEVDGPFRESGRTPGVWSQKGRLVLGGTAVLDEGPADGLEKLACLANGKVHESLVNLRLGDATLLKVLAISALDLAQDGVPAEEESGIPAIGFPVAITVWWRPNALLAPDTWRNVPASCLVIDRSTGRPFPPLPFLYTGSRFTRVDQPGEHGAIVATERFMLEIDLSFANIFDHPDALLASPFPSALRDDLFEVNAALAPAKGTPVYLVCERLEPPLVLSCDADTALTRDGALLDDSALQAALTEVYGGADPPMWPCVGIRIAPQPEQLRSDVRRRILQAAGTAKVWAVPVFLPE